MRLSFGKSRKNRRWSATVSPRAHIAGAVIDVAVILLQIHGGMHGLLLGCLTIGLFAAAGLESLLSIRNSSRVGRGLFLIALRHAALHSGLLPRRAAHPAGAGGAARVRDGV